MEMQTQLIPFFLQGVDFPSHEFEFAFETLKINIKGLWPRTCRCSLGQHIELFSETIEINVVMDAWGA